jgi:hypothetical protein
VFELNSAGDTLLHSTYIGGAGLDLATGVALDGNATPNVYVSGITNSQGLGTNGSVGGATEDGFAAKFDSTLTTQVYFTYVGGSGTDDANAIAVDKATGAAFLTGKTQSIDFPVPGTPFQSMLNGGQDAFVTKINVDGTIGFGTYLGGSGGEDEGLAIAVDSSDNIYVTGVTDSANFPLQGALGTSMTLQGPNDAFITELAASGSTEKFSTFYGGTGSEDENLPSASNIAGGIAVDGTGNIYATGSTNSSMGLPLANAEQGSYGGGPADAWVVKLKP